MRNEDDLKIEGILRKLIDKTDDLIGRINNDIDNANAARKQTQLQSQDQGNEVRKAEISRVANQFKQLEATCQTFANSIVAKQDERLSLLSYYKKKDADVDLLTKQYNALEYSYIKRFNATPEDLKNGVDQELLNPQNLSSRMADIDELEYKISTGRLWARRAALVGIFLGISTLILGVTLLMMTPVGAIGATGSAFMLSLLALGSYLGFRGPVHSTASINISGMPMNISTQVPSAPAPLIQAILMPLMFLSNIKRWTTNKQKVEDARNVQSGVMQKLIDECKELVAQKCGDDHQDVNDFLRGAIEQAESIFHQSTTCRFDENRNSAMAKAKNILQATANILEDERLPQDVLNSVEMLCQHKINIGGTSYQYGDILNSRRRISLFTRSMTNTFRELSKNHPGLKAGFTVALSTTTMAAAFRSAASPA